MAASDDVPEASLRGMSFAESVARDYVNTGGDAKDLFVAYVGAVMTQDSKIGAACLAALDETVRQRSGG